MATTYETRYIPRITTGAGTADAPAIVSRTDADTGIYWPSAEAAVGIVVDGSTFLKLRSAGAQIERYGDIPSLRGYRAGGTVDTPTATSDTGILFDFNAYGYTGAEFAPSGGVRFKQDGAISGANLVGTPELLRMP